MNSSPVYLDTQTPLESCVGYGALGLHGELGYEGGRVMVGGLSQPRAISAHGPSRVVYSLEGRYRRFEARAGFNQDVAGRDTHAHFLICADDRLAACVPLLYPDDGPRDISGDITGCQSLELVVLTSQWEYRHAVWLEARASEEAPPAPPTVWDDPLHRAEIQLPVPRPQARRCIATVVSPGFEDYLHDLLWSLRTFGECRDALVVVFAVNANERCRTLARAYEATLIECRPRATLGLAIKALLYSVASVVDAPWFLCLDADTLVLGSLEPIFAVCELAPPGKILVCREANHIGPSRLGAAIRHTYYGHEHDFHRILGGRVNGEAEYPLVVNDGVFAGGRQALLALEAQLRRMPQGIAWMEEAAHGCWWRNQLLFNLALARLHSGWELDNQFNVQLHTHDVALTGDHDAYFRGRPARILHFAGVGKRKYVEWRRKLRQRFAQP